MMMGANWKCKCSISRVKMKTPVSYLELLLFAPVPQSYGNWNTLIHLFPCIFIILLGRYHLPPSLHDLQYHLLYRGITWSTKGFLKVKTMNHKPESHLGHLLKM